LQTPSAVEPIASSVSHRHATRRPLTFLFLALALGTLWFVCCRHLSGEWRLNDQYSYGWFVPFFVAFLFWLRWEDRPQPEVRSSKLEVRSWIAFFLIVGAAIVLFPVRLFEVANPDWRPLGWLHTGAVVTITLAIIYSAGGRSWLRHFAFPTAFIFVAVPWISAIETPIVQGLMRIVASVAAETVSLFGVPAQVQGNIIRLSTGTVGVNEACSGVRSLQTSIMIGLLFGELKRLTVSRRVALVVIAIAIALFANFLRALFLVLIAARESLAAVGRWHDFAGYAIVALVFLGTMLIARQFGRRGSFPSKKKLGDMEVVTPSAKSLPNLPIEATNSQSGIHSSQFSSLPCSYILLLFAFLLLIEVGVESWYRFHERDMAPTPHWTVRWPENAPGFRELPIDEGVRATLRFDQGRETTWTSANNLSSQPSRCFLFFFRWNTGGSSVVRARAHRPDICLPSAGWTQLEQGRIRNVALKNQLTLPFHEIAFKNASNNAIAHTYFCLQEDRRTNEQRTDLALPPGVQPDWSLPARWRAVRNGVRNMGQQVVEFVVLAPTAASTESADTDFVKLIPNLIEAKN
jgi:exosortase